MMILNKLDNFFTSGWAFGADDHKLKNKFQMMNLSILLSTVALFYGMYSNYERNIDNILETEILIVCINIVLFFSLRIYKMSFPYVSSILTIQFTFFFLFIIYSTEPTQFKHVWIFTYPVILLYLINKKDAVYWVAITIFLLVILPFQPFVDTSYSFFQVIDVVVVLVIISIIIYFYQLKMQEAKDLILKQQSMLKNQIDELTQKDQLLSTQSRQAVMGEMISMVAHQWRQPLSTVTLSVSNLQVKKLLGDKIDDKDFNKALEDISDTVVYLSNTIDDFQTYFRPVKEVTGIEAHELVKKATNFVLPRLKNTKIKIEIENDTHKGIALQIYMNELIQVILNILNNAIDALELADVENPRIGISVEEKGNRALFIIQDNANGIKEEDLSKIFEPYFSTKGKNGTGLGLYMSQMIVQKQFDGKIGVISSENGTFFSVEIQKILS